MKKHLPTLMMLILGSGLSAQSPRVSLFEEFTGETCPPCASTNPGLNAKLLSATNATRIVAIKWQVPIPSAPSNTWSLYQTNKPEIDWRYRSTANGGYGYPSQNNASSAITSGVNSAPSGRIDGQHQWTFGATSDHPTYISDAVIAKAVSMAAPFNIIMTRDNITSSSTSAVVNVTIQATMPYSTTANLVFRNVLVERTITFSVQPGTNGEKVFEDAARASFPTLQGGTTLPKTWTQGQVMTFSMNCVFPSYIRDELEVEFVGFIQNDGTQKVEQASRTDLPHAAFDAVASPIDLPFLCSAANTLAPTVPVKNDGQTAITALTITPYVDGIAQVPTQWTGNIQPGFSGFITLDAFPSAASSGTHTFSYNITGTNGSETNTSNNTAGGTFYSVVNYAAAPLIEGFSAAASTWPYAGWLLKNTNGTSATWQFASGVEGYNLGTGNSIKYNFYNNTVVNDVDELMLPPVDLTGVGVPVMSFDVAYVLRTLASNDKLELKLSGDCGNNWTTMWSAAGSSLAVTQSPMASAYTVPDPWDWATITVNLPGFNQSDVLVKFVATNKNGNNLFLDNINLAASNVPDGIAENRKGSLDLNVYPNPTSGLTSVVITGEKSQLAKLSVMNTIGQVVLEKEVSLNPGKTAVEVDLNSVPAGIYMINVENASMKASSRISVNR